MKDKKQSFLKIYPKTMCNISKTCKQIGISRTSYYKWIDGDLFFKEEVDAAKEALIDDLESEIYYQIFEKHNIIATIFALKCIGKKRGWSEKEEVQISEPKPIRVLDFGDDIIDERV